MALPSLDASLLGTGDGTSGLTSSGNRPWRRARLGVKRPATAPGCSPNPTPSERTGTTRQARSSRTASSGLSPQSEGWRWGRADKPMATRIGWPLALAGNTRVGLGRVGPARLRYGEYDRDNPKAGSN